MALKENYRSGQPLAAISARWLNEVAHILNTIQIEMAPANELPSVQRPPMPGKWTLRIPQGSGEGLPVGTEIWGKVRAEHRTGTAAEEGDGTYFYQGKLVWDGAAFVTKTTEEGEPDETLVAFVPDAQGGGGWVIGNNTILNKGTSESAEWVERAYWGKVTEQNGAPSVAWTEQVAWERNVTLHAADHTPGIL